MSKTELSTPNSEPVWWTFVVGDSTCHVWARLWADAREFAYSEIHDLCPAPGCRIPLPHSHCPTCGK